MLPLTRLSATKANPGQDFVDSVNELFTAAPNAICEVVAHLFEESESVPCYPVPRKMIRFLYSDVGTVTAERAMLQAVVHAIIVRLAFVSGCLPQALHQSLSTLLSGQGFTPSVWHDIEDERLDPPSASNDGIPPSQALVQEASQHRIEAEQLAMVLWLLSGLLTDHLVGGQAAEWEVLHQLHMQILRA